MTKEAIIAVIILGVILICTLVFILVNNKRKKLVLANSERIKKLIELNNKTYFKKLKLEYVNHHKCNSKRQLENFNIDEFFKNLIDENEGFYNNLIQSLDYNFNTYDMYKKDVTEITSTATEELCKSIKIKLSKFLKYENKLFDKKVLFKPQTDVNIYCRVTYTSPAGRNHYFKDRYYTLIDLKKFFNQVIERKKVRQSREYFKKVERSKMTASLRYDILKRDNYKCQICGSTVQDGVKLHVDHIIPISKGGKTVPSNLRTLCDRCNIGKSDKL